MCTYVVIHKHISCIWKIECSQPVTVFSSLQVVVRGHIWLSTPPYRECKDYWRHMPWQLARWPLFQTLISVEKKVCDWLFNLDGTRPEWIWCFCIVGRYKVLGITSWGRGCGKPYSPGVYTKVSTLVDWIHHQLSINSWRVASSWKKESIINYTSNYIIIWSWNIHCNI